MNFFNRRPFSDSISFTKSVDTKLPILYNGQDKKDVEDPTSKFFGPVYVGNYLFSSFTNTSVIRKNVIYAPREYDLSLLANAVQLDGLLRRAVNVFTEYILKNGYQLNSKSDKIQRHVNRRLKEIRNFTGLSFYELMTQIALQLVTYGNAYVIKVRARDMSDFGKDYSLHGWKQNPIVGLFLADATTVYVGLNMVGDVTTYKQFVRGLIKEWDERDVIHFTYNRTPGTLLGMSPLLPIIDDVRALRKLEEEIEILGFQYSIPLYLYKVGNKDVPPAPGEVNEVTRTVAHMPAYGMLVVPGHHDITVPTNQSNTIEIMKYIEHFKHRVYSGIGVSPVTMGESSTANRNTSEVLDASMQAVIKSYQQILKAKLEVGLFREFLLDGGFDDIDDEIELSFPEIDVENQIKVENHIIEKWQNDLITRTEARNEMDYENKIQDGDTFLRTVKIPEIEAMAEAKAKFGGSTDSAGSGDAPALPKPGVGGHSVTKVTHKIVGPQSKAAKTTSNKVAPANQHGKKARPKYVKNSVDNLFNTLSVTNKQTFYTSLFDDVKGQLVKELDYTINEICDYNHLTKPEVDETLLTYLFDGVGISLESRVIRAAKLLDQDLKLKIFGTQTEEFIEDQFDKIENLAKIMICKSLGLKTILITSDECEKHKEVTIDISNINYSNIPPFGYKCRCKISDENFNDR